ncbi:phosphotransferase [Nocardioides sp. CER19]|uniref:phosphotransferase n=1 Tax=Nocardioides sp. CER19 TaxID=3038538 RepID=UPI00244A3EA7|nr:phosphotransferase [Nocardioides sp. CER19]MDH2413633.1 phosphotransferase [Nocardioides sp. CER19]
MSALPDQLTPHQRDLLGSWLPGAVVVGDHSWGLVGTTVLELRTPDGASYVAKAGDDADHQLAREINAHRRWLQPLTSLGRAPELVEADEAAKLLVTRWLPGRLVEGTGAEAAVETYRQAGELLALLHGQSALADEGEFESRQKQETLAWLQARHRIRPEAVAVLTDVAEAWPTPPSVLVPTHGDWQPRNWLMEDGVVSVIDFGRADLRPAHTDLGRLSVQQFRTDPALEQAFLSGYGRDPREPSAWLRLRVREAVATAGWAYKVGDEAFERQGHRMVADVLAEVGGG